MESISSVMGRRFAKFRSLSGADRRLLIRAALRLMAARLALRLMPLKAARRVVVGNPRRLRPAAPPPAERIVWAVEAAGRALPGARNCLIQALAAQAMLLRAGYPCDLRIGVARDGAPQMAAHAWLVAGDGSVLIGDFEPGRYRPLASSGRPG